MHSGQESFDYPLCDYLNAAEASHFGGVEEI
jgi:hypothetical protein